MDCSLPGSSVHGIFQARVLEWGAIAFSLAWRIPWTKEPGKLQSMRALRVEHDWATSLSLLTFMHWRRKWQPTPVFLPGESQGQRSLVGCHLWGHTESDTTEVTQQQQQQDSYNSVNYLFNSNKSCEKVFWKNMGKEQSGSVSLLCVFRELFY